ncbi:MAG: MerR family transcriptional regulator [Actinomycetota bacterium]
MRYRVDELAARSGMSVDTVRFYQGKGLLEAPQREGRVAWYSDDHVARLGRIRHLKEQGFNLASIGRLLAADLDPADEALVAALAGPILGGPEEWLTLEELAARTSVSPALLRGIEREGLLVPEVRNGVAFYTSSDVQAVASGLRLLEAGIPLTELIALARAHEGAMKEVAERAVELFDEFVRRPLRNEAVPPEAAERLVDAFRTMFPATTTLVAHHFGRLLLRAAHERIEREGVDFEVDENHVDAREVEGA